MPDKTTNAPRPAAGGAARPCEAVALASVRAFCGLLDRAIAENGRPLSEADIAQAFRSFSGSSTAMKRFYRKSYETCAQGFADSRERRQRSDIFGRLLVRPFEHLLVGGPESRSDPPAIERSALPGFFRALSLMLGEAVLEERRALCSGVYETYRARHGDETDWERFHADPSILQLQARTIADIAACFANFERRVDWFVSLLGHGSDGAMCVPGGDRGCGFGRLEFVAMMRALFSVVDGLDHGPGAAVNLMPGDQTVIAEFLENLDRLETLIAPAKKVRQIA